MTRLFTLVYGDTRLPYKVTEDARRSNKVAIHVDPDGTVLVDVPFGISDEAVQSAVQKRARWITSHVAASTARFAHVSPREYVSGEQVLYLGRRYILKVTVCEKPVKSAKLRGNRLDVQSLTGVPSDIQGRVRAWYRAKARDYFAHRLTEMAARFSWIDSPPTFRLLEMSRQWGSCSPAGQLIFNPHLIKTPRACVDYVIVHELAHLKHHNHGPEFLRLMDREVPDWRSHKTQLDKMVELVTNG